MRLGHIFSAAAKGKDPEPGVFHFVENAASTDPLAGTATFTSPFSDSSEYGNDFSTDAAAGNGWDATSDVGWQTAASDGGSAYQSGEPGLQRGTDRDRIDVGERGDEGQGRLDIVKGELPSGGGTEMVQPSGDMTRGFGTRGGNAGRNNALGFQTDGVSGGGNSGEAFNRQAQCFGKSGGREVYSDRYSRTPAEVGGASSAADRARVVRHEAEIRENGVLRGDGWREAAAPSEPVSSPEHRAADIGENCMVKDQSPGLSLGVGASGHLEGSRAEDNGASVVHGSAATVEHRGRLNMPKRCDGDITRKSYGTSSKQGTGIPPVVRGREKGGEGQKYRLLREQSFSWTPQGRQDPGLERRSDGEQWRDR